MNFDIVVRVDEVRINININNHMTSQELAELIATLQHKLATMRTLEGALT